MSNEFNNSMRLICPEELAKPRFIPKSNLLKEDAKKIALANGIIWGCD